MPALEPLPRPPKSFNTATDHVFKATPRALMLSDLPRVEHALFMPGERCIDLEQAWMRGVINQQTILRLYERHVWLYQPIKDFVRKHEFDARMVFRDILKEQLPEGLDFAFFDFCGELTPNTINFLKRNRKVIQGCKRVGFTFSIHMRNSFFYQTRHYGDVVRYPANAQILMNETLVEKAKWTAHNVLYTLHLRDLAAFTMYRESGKAISMVFFMINL